MVQLLRKIVWKFLNSLPVGVPRGPAILFLGLHPRETETHPHHTLYRDMHTGFTRNTQKVETTQTPISGCTDKHSEACPHEGMGRSHTEHEAPTRAPSSVCLKTGCSAREAGQEGPRGTRPHHGQVRRDRHQRPSARGLAGCRETGTERYGNGVPSRGAGSVVKLWQCLRSLRI